MDDALEESLTQGRVGAFLHKNGDALQNVLILDLVGPVRCGRLGDDYKKNELEYEVTFVNDLDGIVSHEHAMVDADRPESAGTRDQQVLVFKSLNDVIQELLDVLLHGLSKGNHYVAHTAQECGTGPLQGDPLIRHLEQE